MLAAKIWATLRNITQLLLQKNLSENISIRLWFGVLFREENSIPVFDILWNKLIDSIINIFF